MINIDEVETNLAFMQFDYFRSKIYIYEVWKIHSKIRENE